MTKATSTVKQQPVQVSIVDGKTYVYIYLNEKEVQREDVSEDGTGTKSTQYEYDYNEFSFSGNAFDVNDIMEHPDNYLETSTVEKKKQEANPSLEERVSAIEEMLLADMGGE